jgi:hypothetical protein
MRKSRLWTPCLPLPRHIQAGREKIDAVVMECGDAAFELAERIYISKTVLSLIMVSPEVVRRSLRGPWPAASPGS